MSAEVLEVTFGSPEFGREVYSAFSAQLDAVKNVETAMNDLSRFFEKNTTDSVQKVVYFVVRVTAETWDDVLILAGHGSDIGAMKIARGMFESSVIAEYLRQHPAEAEDFRAYGYVQRWNRYRSLLKSSPDTANKIAPQTIKELEANYDRVISRFSNKDRVRGQWNKKSIAQIAKDVGRSEQYKTPYSLSASIHHSNFEGISAHLDPRENNVSPYARPSLRWIHPALISAHVYMLQALQTLNDSFLAGFDERIRAAWEEFERVWGNKQSDAQPLP